MLYDQSKFLVRIKVDRRTDDETKTIESVLASAKTKGKYSIKYKDSDGKDVNALLQVKFETITIRPPFGVKRDRYPDLKVTVVRATELSKPGKGRQAIDWKIVTNLQVTNLAEAVEKLEWYALRWKIEVFFK